MNKKIVFATVILITLFLGGYYLLRNKTVSLVSPGISLKTQNTETTLPAVEINQPKEIKYDSSTDLKKELENINPQVNESDF